MSDSRIRIDPVPWPDGPDIDKLALVLLELVDRLPARRIRDLAGAGEELIAKAEAEVKPESDAGSAA